MSCLDSAFAHAHRPVDCGGSDDLSLMPPSLPITQIDAFKLHGPCMDRNEQHGRNPEDSSR